MFTLSLGSKVSLTQIFNIRISLEYLHHILYILEIRHLIKKGKYEFKEYIKLYKRKVVFVRTG